MSIKVNDLKAHVTMSNVILQETVYIIVCCELFRQFEAHVLPIVGEWCETP